jgi:phosphoadenosine phosphosulfate reductase
MLTHAAASSTEIEDTSTPEEIVAWTLRRFAGRNLVVSTSFGMEGCALIDMVARHGVSVPVIYLDTMFLFPETYALRDRMVARYPHLRFENRGTTLTPEAQAERFGAELWRREPDRCCAIRKVEPMRQALTGVDVWVTGLMRSQGGERANLGELQWNESYGLVQVNPLAGWDRRRVWDYVLAHDVPYNALHERGYPTLGCTHCTVAVAGAGPRDYTRNGRWAGTDKTECGLHLSPAGHFARKA